MRKCYVYFTLLLLLSLYFCIPGAEAASVSEEQALLIWSEATDSGDIPAFYYIDDINDSNKNERIYIPELKFDYSVGIGFFSKEDLWNALLRKLKYIPINHNNIYRDPYWHTVKIYRPAKYGYGNLLTSTLSSDCAIEYGTRVMLWPSPEVEWSDSMRVKYLRLYVDALHKFAENGRYNTPELTAISRARRKAWVEEVEQTENKGYRASALSELRLLTQMMEESYVKGNWYDNARLWQGVKVLREQMEQEISFDINIKSYESRDIVLPVVFPVQIEDFYQNYPLEDIYPNFP